MGENNSLNFDEVRPQEVVLHGRTFVLREQSAPMVQKILEIAGVDNERTVEGEGEKAVVQSMFANWDEQVRATALMLGYDEADEELDKGVCAEVLKHLRQHLSPRQAMLIFSEWWRINDIAGFFMRGGRVLMSPSTVVELEAIRREWARIETEKLLAEARVAIEEPPTDTPPTVN